MRICYGRQVRRADGAGAYLRIRVGSTCWRRAWPVTLDRRRANGRKAAANDLTATEPRTTAKADDATFTVAN